MFNYRILYHIGRRLFYTLGVALLLVAAVFAVFAVFAFVYACFSVSQLLFGTAIYGLIPVILTTLIGGLYPIALQDYKAEQKQQLDIFERLKKDDEFTRKYR